ncbi:MAG: tetratricopeptide repeat protein [Comamonadaceae bacterium]|nr:MAG: tetratricopeptide repeat protein [Comamonadaceae bacterium]
MGVCGVESRWQARRKLSFWRGAKVIPDCRRSRPIIAGHLLRPSAMNGTFEQARNFFLDGLAHYQAGRFPQAETSLAASLALLPGRASTLTNLGATRLKLGRAQEALELLDEALAQEPVNVEALGHRAAALAELGRRDDALACLQRVLGLQPELGHAWSLRGSLLQEAGRMEEAAASFEQALAHGGDPELNRYYLAGLRGGITPAAPPRHYVENLFDGYAGQFDAHLQALNYQVPALLAQGLPQGRRFKAALDLGCGTGQCAPLLRPWAAALDGVDLSSNMLAQAGTLKLYRSLVQADLADHLATTPQRYDLVVAADVFIYVGALDAAFAGVARVIEAGGVFCCSVEEAGQGHDLQLQPSLRYAHSEGYLRALAQQHGMEVTQVQRGAVREDQRVAIPGLFAWLVRP